MMMTKISPPTMASRSAGRTPLHSGTTTTLSKTFQWLTSKLDPLQPMQACKHHMHPAPLSIMAEVGVGMA